MTRISIVIPAHNEEENIPILMNKIKKVFGRKINGEVILVDDASTDGTGKLAEGLKKKYRFLKVIHNRKRLGFTGASALGFNQAGEKIIVLLPSDLESDPEEDVPKLVNNLKDCDVVVGWRQGKISFVKSITSKLFNLLSRTLFHVNAHDMGWVKAFRKDVLNDIQDLRSDWHRFFVVLAAYKGYKVKEIKTNFYPRKYGKSKFGRLGLMRLPGGFFDLLVVKFHLSFSKKPMHIFGSLGTILLFFGFLGAVYLLAARITEGSIAAHTPMLFLTTLFVLSGIQLFAMGFIAEFLVTIKDEIKKLKER